MVAVHEVLAVNVVALWLVTAAVSVVMLRRRRGLTPERYEQSAQNGTNPTDLDRLLVDWQPEA